MPESEKLLVKRATLNAVLDAMERVYDKIARNPLIRAAVAADQDVQRLRTALIVLRSELTQS
jgi:hypothetical protein